MPQKPRRPCRYPGCPGFCEQGQVFCKDHMEWSSDRLRGGADARGYNSRWRKARALFLKRPAAVLGSDELGAALQGMP